MCARYIYCRLVTADIAYYTDQMKSLPGLAQTNDDMSSIWDKT